MARERLPECRSQVRLHEGGFCSCLGDVSTGWCRFRCVSMFVVLPETRSLLKSFGTLPSFYPRFFVSGNASPGSQSVPTQETLATGEGPQAPVYR